MNVSEGIAIILIALLYESFALDSTNIVIVILSQENSYHETNAEFLKENILHQAESLQVSQDSQVIVELLPDEKTHIGYWTIIPLFRRLVRDHGKNSTWIYFCEDSTIINLKRLISGLQKFGKTEKTWIGFGLNDEEPTIIHHFAFPENPTIFKYPLISAGFAITTSLLKDLNLRKISDTEKESEFSIDASHELALYIGETYPLQHKPSLFCDKPAESCASYPNKVKYCRPTLDDNEIYFAVKTCHKYHLNRVPFVQKSWGKEAKYIKFFSDIANETIPTTQVGIKNTERGHCLKTMKILTMALEEVTNSLKNVKWVILADDDTILSVKRLQSHLSCYTPDTIVGERYGYKVLSGHGYNYLTGGGGIAFGIDTLQDIVKFCNCPQIDSPDDMVLGLCIATLNISLTHSPLFHQARPMDYASSYLEIGYPVSFHKHWNVDPMLVYTKWLSVPSNNKIGRAHV